MIFSISGKKVRKGGKFFLIAGPCVIESEKLCIDIAKKVKDICRKEGIFYIFKSSFDKANRSSIKSFRGPGFEKGLDILANVKSKAGVPILSDIHEPNQAVDASQVLDVIQIPAFLCRQTDLLIEAAKTGKPLNVKKGQFLAPRDVSNIIEKIQSAGNKKIMLTERGTTFGYNNLVVDFRGIEIMKKMPSLVGFDATHSVQLPGGRGVSSGGESEYIFPLVCAASAVGVDFIYAEVHTNPAKALCDAPNTLSLGALKKLIRKAKAIEKAVKR
ncbi:MAG: 3-deoxy-8-phosphooctulonate synthase [Candidatus Schekmanbacteria bacterium]|nr:MAG: 3-deoxy-8-phosphooctulonate synthase [Candidatus Schekmanbacteria bacterium]